MLDAKEFHLLVCSLFGHGKHEQSTITELFDDIDHDDDGLISWDEFLRMLRSRAGVNFNAHLPQTYSTRMPGSL